MAGTRFRIERSGDGRSFFYAPYHNDPTSDTFNGNLRKAARRIAAMGWDTRIIDTRTFEVRWSSK